MIIDSHCHLDYEPLVNNINDVLLNAKKNNITNLLTIGTSLESSKKVLEIVENMKIFMVLLVFIQTQPRDI